MSYKLTNLTIIRVFLLLCTIGTAACAAPPMDGVIAGGSTESTLPTIDEQIIGPLITVDREGNFQPGLAESWTTSTSADRETLTVNFRVPSVASGDSDDFIRAEDVTNSLEQRWENDPSTTGAGTQGGNPCIIPTPTPSIPKGPFEVSPVDNETGTIGVSMLLEACSEESSECEKQILSAVSNFPIYQTENLSYYASTGAGTYIFEDQSDDGDVVMLEYNPETGQTDICPDCEPDGPSPRPTCTPSSGS